MGSSPRRVNIVRKTPRAGNPAYSGRVFSPDRARALLPYAVNGHGTLLHVASVKIFHCSVRNNIHFPDQKANADNPPSPNLLRHRRYRSKTSPCTTPCRTFPVSAWIMFSQGCLPSETSSNTGVLSCLSSWQVPLYWTYWWSNIIVRNNPGHAWPWSIAGYGDLISCDLARCPNIKMMTKLWCNSVLRPRE